MTPVIRSLSLLALLALAAGCATPPRPAPLTQADIISMTKVRMTDEEIIRRIDETGTVFNLSSDDVVLLRKEGVSDRVVNYLLETRTRAAIEQERRRSYYHFNFHYQYGHPRWYW